MNLSRSNLQTKGAKASHEFGGASSHRCLHRQGLDHVPPALTTLPSSALLYG